MTVDAPEAPVPVAPAAPSKPNPFQRIAGVFIAPAKTFVEIVRQPNILVPLLLIIAIGYGSTILLMPKMNWKAITDMQMEQIRKKNPNVSDADLARMEKFTIAFAKVGSWVSPLIAAAIYLIIAGVMLLAFRMMGGEGDYQQALSVTLHAWFPLVLWGIIAAIVGMARGSVDPTQMQTIVASNPGILVSMKDHPVLFSLLASFDIFTIWTVVLMIIGFAAMSRFSRAKSAAIVLALWFALIVVKVGFAALGAGLRS